MNSLHSAVRDGRGTPQQPVDHHHEGVAGVALEQQQVVLLRGQETAILEEVRVLPASWR